MSEWIGKGKQVRIQAAAVAACLMMASGTAGAQVVTSCPAALESTQLFSYTGAPATFTVPANVVQVRFIAVGADGGDIAGAATAGGAGARAEGSFAVLPGAVFTVIAGQAPVGGDFEAGGGGASGAYFGTTGSSLALVAGGGGGDDNTAGAAGSGAGTASNDGGNGGNPAGNNCPDGGLGGTAGAGGQFGERNNADPTQACQTGNGGGGGGGFLAAGENSNVLLAARSGPRGGVRCNIAGAAGGSAGTEAGAAGTVGGFGLCGGGGADDREGGGGGGYSGGGGGPESQYPGGGGSFVAAAATTPVLAAGGTAGRGGGSGRNGSVRACYTQRADLVITKTNTPASGASDLPADTVSPGSTVNYSIVVTNNGGASANGAAIRDPAPSGLTCTTATCAVTTGAATCPAATGVALRNALQSGAGAVVPAMPVGGVITLTLTCTVL